MSLTKKSIDLKPGLKKLHRWLQEAIEIEHATIPPYFAAWVSIMDGYNQEPADIVRSVFTEEMLHLTLAANILNAVGGHPDLIHPEFVPRYPHKLPHSGDHFLIHIEKFSGESLQTFKKIERPQAVNAKPEEKQFKTIAQFYAAVGSLLDELCEAYGEKKIFTGEKQLQIQPEDYYGSGELIVVSDRKTAHKAIAIIVDQGEGAHHSIFDDDHQIFGDGGGMELAHYYRFDEIYQQRHYTTADTPKSGPTGKPFYVDYAKVHPFRKNTNRTDFSKNSEIRNALDDFAASYGALLKVLHFAFNGQRSRINESFARMFAIKNQALALMRTPLGNGVETVGPDFTQIVPKK